MILVIFLTQKAIKKIAAEGISKHILRSWDPRMRNDIITYCMQDGSGLNDLTKVAILKLQQS